MSGCDATAEIWREERRASQEVLEREAARETRQPANVKWNYKPRGVRSFNSIMPLMNEFWVERWRIYLAALKEKTAGRRQPGRGAWDELTLFPCHHDLFSGNEANMGEKAEVTLVNEEQSGEKNLPAGIRR